MTPLFLLGAGTVLLVAGVVVLLSYGSRYRVGRLLAATPVVTIGDAIRFAEAGDQRYVRVDGRLDSETDFPDEHHRPLVYRRRRLQLRRAFRWQTIEDHVESVPFEINEGLTSIAIDRTALGDGLVVLPRESTGTAGEVPDQMPPGTPPATPARFRVDQISSIEHAVVLGMPVQTADGVQLTAGRGRPLVLTTLEIPEAMRILGGGRRRPMAVIAFISGGADRVRAGRRLGAPSGPDRRLTSRRISLRLGS